jgi:hypothetical protein
MVEGFWIVQYEGVRGNGGGVAVFMKGHVLGGDTGFIYTGTYEVSERQQLLAHIKVRNFLPEVPNVLGVQGDFELLLKGAVAGPVIKAAASLVGQAAAGIIVKLTRVSDLPA